MKYLIQTILILIIPLTSEAKIFKSKFGFKFQLQDEYQILNDKNLYEVYNSSHKNPELKKQINVFSKKLKGQNIEILFNFKQSLFNNFSILVFNENYKINKKKVLRQCKKILKIEKKFGKRNVDLIECRMHQYPKFADWSMYRENESSFFENVLTQQIIFMFRKKEYVITVACFEKCEQTKKDLFLMIKTLNF